MANLHPVAIIGGGLAGSEAAWQLGKNKVPTVLFEMRPQQKTPAHRTGGLAELVCSNSFKSLETGNAHGLLKAELELLDSLIIQSARKSQIPAGSALAVDRDQFSAAVQSHLESLPDLEIRREEAISLPSLLQEFSFILIATGPLTSDALAQSLQETLGEKELFFYDSIAPVIFTESINRDIAFLGSRYGKGTDDYLNCPLNQEEYEELIDDLLSAEKMPFKDFEKDKYFEGCLPVEVMAERGRETLSFGPMKPVGFTDPRTGKRPHAILQLRQENQQGTLFNMVGCQTKMTYPEQKRVFSKIPGLEKCEFARLGSMHRNTYINAPRHLTSELSLKTESRIHLAGQLTGVEGYTESTAMGLWAARQIQAKVNNQTPPEPNPQTMIGALVNYLMTASPYNFQPMNSNFGLLMPIPVKGKMKKKERRQKQADFALNLWTEFLNQR